MRPWYFTSVSCPVDGAIDELDMPLEVVPLPGHTQWQVGFLTPDNVLAAADAIVTKKVWDTKRIVYYTSPDDARRSLEYIRDCGADYVIPSHCSLLSKDEAAGLAEVNLKGIDMLEEAVLKVLGREERTTEEMVSGTGCALKIRDDFTMNIVVETTVRAFSCCGPWGQVRYERVGSRNLL
jgi:glyoxylase-like metal-dependent hydrolase (beta-lactamase superfamily II)